MCLFSRLAEGLKIPAVKYQIITREGQEIVVSLYLNLST